MLPYLPADEALLHAAAVLEDVVLRGLQTPTERRQCRAAVSLIRISAVASSAYQRNVERDISELSRALEITTADLGSVPLRTAHHRVLVGAAHALAPAGDPTPELRRAVRASLDRWIAAHGPASALGEFVRLDQSSVFADTPRPTRPEGGQALAHRS
jgi:hypothetical protein